MKTTEDIQVMLIRVDERRQKAAEMQSLFTKYGCNIKTRLGLHEAGNVCSNQGLIFLQLTGELDELKVFEHELSEIEGVTAKLTGI